MTPPSQSRKVTGSTQGGHRSGAAADLDGKVTLVTGGGAGIGRATALAFADAGARVVVADVDRAGGEDTARAVRERGGAARFIATDVTRAGSVEAMVAATVAVFGRLDCAFNNAGVGSLSRTHEYREEDWDRVMAVNLKGVWLCVKYEVLRMLEQGSGAIVNMASATGLVGARNAAAYVTSKHGVVGLTRAAALEYAEHGIRVNAVCPGVIRTRMHGGRLEDAAEVAHLTAYHPIGRLGEPEEVAAAVVWLSSDAASFVTGTMLSVDGAWTAG